MRSILLASVSLIVLNCVALAADLPSKTKLADFETSVPDFTKSGLSLTLEAMPIFVQQDPSLRFDPTDDKLGGLHGLSPGRRGWQGRLAITKAFDVWDTRVALSMIDFGHDRSGASYKTYSSYFSRADQKSRAGVLDVEAGFRPLATDGFDLRVFGGTRFIMSKSRAAWSTDAVDDKLGTFDDQARGLGLRVGMDLTMPLNEPVDFVASGSASILRARGSSAYQWGSSTTTNYVNNRDYFWMKNLDATAGLSVKLNVGAKLQASYRVQYWGDTFAQHSGVRRNANAPTAWSGSAISHGPVVSLTFPLGR